MLSIDMSSEGALDIRLQSFFRRGEADETFLGQVEMSRICESEC